jgi:hypothetical protein
MKKPPKYFYSAYPYLTYWIEDWGYMQIGNDDDFPYGGFIKLIDQGGVVFETDEGERLDDYFEKAEKYLREVEFPDRMDQETIDSLEEDYKKYGLK